MYSSYSNVIKEAAEEAGFEVSEDALGWVIDSIPDIVKRIPEP